MPDSDDDFDTLLRAAGPAATLVVDFSAEWCPPPPPAAGGRQLALIRLGPIRVIPIRVMSVRVMRIRRAESVPIRVR